MKVDEEFFRATHSFRKLKISALLPEISHGDFKTMAIIQCLNQKNGNNGVKISDVAANRDIAVPAVSRTLKTLEERGLIVRSVDKKDRRNTYVQLTAKGEKFLAECHTIMHELFTAIMVRMGEEKANILIQGLKELYVIAEDEIGKRKYVDRKDKAENEKNI